MISAARGPNPAASTRLDRLANVRGARIPRAASCFNMIDLPGLLCRARIRGHSRLGPAVQQALVRKLVNMQDWRSPGCAKRSQGQERLLDAKSSAPCTPVIAPRIPRRGLSSAVSARLPAPARPSVN
jgi:hypothetical protein